MTEGLTFDGISVFIHDRSQLEQTLLGGDGGLVLEDTTDLDDVLVHLLISEDAWADLTLLTKWAVFTRLSLYFFWAAMFCSLFLVPLFYLHLPSSSSPDSCFSLQTLMATNISRASTPRHR
jgi:hypothetical protein